ncbi:hypothetical protein Q3G72_029628 [Acer saccharum]|nr:hypothetical protein Q3G72_029628 [Acer saccharum]
MVSQDRTWSESELKQAIVREISNKLNTHTIGIREENSGHEDEEAIHVPQNTVERMFVASNLILEIPSAVFDQLSSVHKPQYVLLSMLMSLTTMLICIIELVYKGGEARVGWRSESVLIQTIVNDICNRLNYMLPEDTHFVDIREDEVAIQVPKNTVERMFVASNLILEVPSAVFDQLSSVHKPQYVLVIMLMSLTAMLICIIELAYKGGEARVGWRWGKKKIPWFYHPSPSDKPFGTVTDFIGLLCSFFQCIFSVSHYVFYLRNINDPINISIWPLVFAFCLLCSTFSKKSPKKEALL